nr:MAG TPA: Regulatory phage protein cox [Caudoviricetes sp.]
MIPTLTLNEAAAYLRAQGLGISNDTLAAGLEQGVFSFGTAFRPNGRNRVAMIYKVLLDQWIQERSEG